jgi:hypothetical protein
MFCSSTQGLNREDLWPVLGRYIPASTWAVVSTFFDTLVTE